MGAVSDQLNKERLTVSCKGWMLCVVMIVCPLADLTYKFAHMLIIINIIIKFISDKTSSIYIYIKYN